MFIAVSSNQNPLAEENFTSAKTIIVCNLNGEYFTTIYSSDWVDEENNKTVLLGSLTVYPQQGKLFWTQVMASGHHNIIMSNMNASSYTIIYTEKIIPFVSGFTSKYLNYFIIPTYILYAYTILYIHYICILYTYKI